jgi:transposase
MKYGRSSERLEHPQLELVGGQVVLTEPPEPAGTGKVASLDEQRRKRAWRPRPNLRELPAHLPRRTVMHWPAGHNAGCGCAACGLALREIGQDISEVLDYEPGSFHVVRHVRPKLACGGCKTIAQASAPSRPIDRILAGAGLLAQVLVSKYCDHTPLYRQSQIYARAGLDLHRSTLTDWVGQAAQLLTPLAQAIGRYVLQADKVHGDDTPIRALGGKGGKVHTGRLWVYVRDDRNSGQQAAPAVWFQYSVDRKGEHPAAHLKHFSGVLQADAFAGYNALYDEDRQPGRIIEAGCWSHARRKLWDIHVRHAQAGRHAGAPGAAAHRRAVQDRGPRSRVGLPTSDGSGEEASTAPLLKDLRAWMMPTLSQVSAKSPMALAVGYALSNWTALTQFVDDGRIEAHNNAAERALRCVALGRKNYLHLGSDVGGHSAAVIYTLIGSAKLNGIDPQCYLTYVLERIGGHPSTASTICCRGPWRRSSRRPGSSPSWPRRPDAGAQRHPVPPPLQCGMGTTSIDASELHAWQLYVELEDVQTRRSGAGCWCPLDIDLSRLHVALLWGTGWDGGHIHEFIFGPDHYGATEPGREFPDDLQPEEDVLLSQALGRRKSFKYLYDFGDSWWHSVKVEQIVRLDVPLDFARCIAGENACPPEDVGGRAGYEEFLEALADPITRSTPISRSGSVAPSIHAPSTSTRSTGGLLRLSKRRQQRPSSDSYVRAFCSGGRARVPA